MPKIISDIATVTVGYSFRGKVPLSEEGGLSVVQMKNIGVQGEIPTDRLDRIALFPQYEKYLLHPNDILLISRGARNTASLIPNDFPLAIAVSYFIVIRIRDNAILPEFLMIYLNHPKTQGRIRELARGTAMPMVSISELAGLTVDIPSFERQQLLVKLDHAHRYAERLETEIQTKRRIMIEHEMERFIY